MKVKNLMPCGKKDCSKCETCKYDMSIDTPLLNIKVNKMKNFNLIPIDGNPSTTQLILPGLNNRNNVPIFDSPTQLSLPFKREINPKNCIYCNDCENFLKLPKTNKQSFNTRCSAETDRPGGSYRIIKLNVYDNEKVKKPFWCPIIKSSIINGTVNEKHMTVGGKKIYLSENESTISREQIKREKAIKEKWLSIKGITSWEEIKIGKIYHLPPTIKKNRMDLYVRQKYAGSMQCVDIREDKNIWLYKTDEEYKFLSLV